MCGFIGDLGRFLVPRACPSGLGSFPSFFPTCQQGSVHSFLSLNNLHCTVSLMHTCTLSLCPGLYMPECLGECIEGSRTFHPCSAAVASLLGLCSSLQRGSSISIPQLSCCRCSEGIAVIFQGGSMSPTAPDLSHWAPGDKTGVGCPCLGTLLLIFQPWVGVAGEGP